MADGILGRFLSADYRQPRSPLPDISVEDFLQHKSDADILRRHGLIRPIGACAVNPPMNPYEYAYYGDTANITLISDKRPGVHRRLPLIPHEAAATNAEIHAKAIELTSGELNQ